MVGNRNNPYKTYYPAFELLLEASQNYNIGQLKEADNSLNRLKEVYPKFPNMLEVLRFQAEIHFQLQHFHDGGHDGTHADHALATLYLLQAAKLDKTPQTKVELVEIFGLVTNQPSNNYIDEVHRENVHTNCLQAVNVILRTELGTESPRLVQLNNPITPDFIYNFLHCYLNKQTVTAEQLNAGLDALRHLLDHLKKEEYKLQEQLAIFSAQQGHADKKPLLLLKSKILFDIARIYLKKFKVTGKKSDLDKFIQYSEALESNHVALNKIEYQKTSEYNHIKPIFDIIKTWKAPSTWWQKIKNFFYLLFTPKSYWSSRFDEISRDKPARVLDNPLTHTKINNILTSHLSAKEQTVNPGQAHETRRHHSGKATVDVHNSITPNRLTVVLSGFSEYQAIQKKAMAATSNKTNPAKNYSKKTRQDRLRQRTPSTETAPPPYAAVQEHDAAMAQNSRRFYAIPSSPSFSSSRSSSSCSSRSPSPRSSSSSRSSSSCSSRTLSSSPQEQQTGQRRTLSSSPQEQQTGQQRTTPSFGAFRIVSSV